MFIIPIILLSFMSIQLSLFSIWMSIYHNVFKSIWRICLKAYLSSISLCVFLWYSFHFISFQNTHWWRWLVFMFEVYSNQKHENHEWEVFGTSLTSISIRREKANTTETKKNFSPFENGNLWKKVVSFFDSQFRLSFQVAEKNKVGKKKVWKQIVWKHLHWL